MCNKKKIFYKVYRVNLDGSLEDIDGIISATEDEIKNQNRELIRKVFNLLGFASTYVTSFREVMPPENKDSLDNINISYCDWRGSLASEATTLVPHWKLIKL